METIINKIRFLIFRQIHRLYCLFWSKVLPKDLNKLLKEWKKIDHRKDRSVSAKDFRFWLYLRLVRKHRMKW